MAVVLYHHPLSRANTVVWFLEEAGVPYELRFVDLRAGAQKAPELRALNPMGKIPVLVDGEAVVTEVAAIGLYLADRYAPGRLAPAVDDPARAAYLRWSLFAPSVLEPGALVKAAGWAYTASQAGWGEHDAMIAATRSAIGDGPWLLGDRFTMADAIFGGTVRYLLHTGMLAPEPAFTAYAERLGARPALHAADAKNAAVMAAHGLQPR
ncbi:MAG: glutathione S-transferase family protein [Myxococcota bacterium]